MHALFSDYLRSKIHYERRTENECKSLPFSDSVSKLMKNIIGNPESIFDPSCSDGSLLKIFSENQAKIFGHELNNKKESITKLRFAFYKSATITTGNNVTQPLILNKKYDADVTNLIAGKEIRFMLNLILDGYLKCIISLPLVARLKNSNANFSKYGSYIFILSKKTSESTMLMIQISSNETHQIGSEIVLKNETI